MYVCVCVLCSQPGELAFIIYQFTRIYIFVHYVFRIRERSIEEAAQNTR